MWTLHLFLEFIQRQTLRNSLTSLSRKSFQHSHTFSPGKDICNKMLNWSLKSLICKYLLPFYLHVARHPIIFGIRVVLGGSPCTNGAIIPACRPQAAAAALEGGEASSWSRSTQTCSQTKAAGSAVQSSVRLRRPGHRWAQLQRRWCHRDTHWRYRSGVSVHCQTQQNISAWSLF